jgi:hypothetical protein
MALAEAKAKVKKRQQVGIRDYQRWLGRQGRVPSHAMKVEMFDFFLDQAMKKR